MNPDLLAQINPRVAIEAPLLSAMLVVRGGELVFEQYYHDHPPDQPIHVWSVTKSVAGIATGIAFHEGLLTDLDQTAGELVPDRIPAGADPRVADITLEHLLTMTAGWAWDTRTNFTGTWKPIRLMSCSPGRWSATRECASNTTPPARTCSR